ncbi:MAG: protein kinase domain-containing protein [Pyrinomonadaceae bacterium]
MAKTPRSEADLIGKEFFNFRITEKLGAGGQGDVYKAIDVKLERPVVIKVLPPELTENAANLGRFEREARLASSLDHPNICSIFSFDSADGMYFIAMQLVNGKNVRELVNGTPLDLRSTLSIGLQVCDALAAAHSQGIIHRDIKANNVMVTAEGQVKILDFGLAKLLQDEIEQLLDPHEQKHLTEVGIPYGTATYAAPEQAQGLKVDERADIFSTGVLLFEMLTGRWPFDGKTALDVRYKVVNDQARRLSEARPGPVPPKLQEILDRAMAKNPDDRYQRIVEMRDDLRGLFHDLSVSDDPQFREELTPSAPRYMGGERTDAPAARSFASRGAWIAGSLIGILLIAGVSLWFLTGGFKRSLFGGPSGNVILRLAGSNTIGAKLAPAMIEEFLRKQGAKDVRTVAGASIEEITVVGLMPGESVSTVVEIRSHGSATAFTDLAEKKCDIGLSSRKIKPDEAEKLASLGDMTSPTSEHIVALDGLAVIVNRNNPLSSLTREQIAKIFSGEIKDWSQLLAPGGQINVYARDEKSGTFDFFQSAVLGNAHIVTAAKRFEDSNELSNAVAADPNGIGFIGLPYIRDAKAIAVSDGDSVPLIPNRMTVATEDYILARRLYLYTSPSSENVWVKKFVEFAIAPQAQEIVSNEGFVALKIESQTASVDGTAPSEYKQFTSGAERLSLNFRFSKGGKELDNKARLDLDRVVDFLSISNMSGQNLLLLGFADDGGNSGAEIALSKDRAQTVAEELKRRGIAPRVANGFGNYMPVASNATEDGREKNRRVELWLKK